MNPEEYVIIKKEDFERIEKFFYIDGALKPLLLKPLLEETFKAARTINSGVISNSIQHKYPNFEDFIEQKEI